LLRRYGHRHDARSTVCGGVAAAGGLRALRVLLTFDHGRPAAEP